MMFVVLIIVAVILSIIDIKKLVVTGEKTEIVVYLVFMVLGIGCLSWYALDPNASIARIMLNLFGVKG